VKRRLYCARCREEVKMAYIKPREICHCLEGEIQVYNYYCPECHSIIAIGRLEHEKASPEIS